MRLPLTSIKEDVKMGFTYMEYSGKWHEYNYHIILENDSVIFCFEWKDMQALFDFPLNVILESNYKYFTYLVSKGIYYNLYPIPLVGEVLEGVEK